MTSKLIDAKKERNRIEKNLRRRVYDSLNVLKALDILKKSEKKEVYYNSQALDAAQNEDEEMKDEIQNDFMPQVELDVNNFEKD